MSKLIPSAKSGSEWTFNELKAYNITVVHQDSAAFITPHLSQPTVNSEVLTAPDLNDAADDIFCVLLRTIDLAMSISPAESTILQCHCYEHLAARQAGFQGQGRTSPSLFVVRIIKHTQIDVLSTIPSSY
jgi:hypothetical protein